MITFNVLWVIFIAIYIALFLGLVLLRFSLSNEKFTYSYKRNFPYEILTSGSKVSRAYKIVLFIYVGFSFSPLFCILPSISNFGNIAWLAILIAILYGFCGVFNAAIHIFEAKFIKVHSLLVTIFISLAILSSALSALFAFLSFQASTKFNLGGAYELAYFGIFIALTLFNIIIALNPNLKDWTKLDKIKNDDGSINFERPKVFILALSEWLIILTSFISEIIFFLSLLKL